MVRGISSNFGVMSLAVLLPLALSCFITNCPPGGKRSNLPPLNQENSAILRRVKFLISKLICLKKQIIHGNYLIFV